jgi:hypothetical protein
VKGGLTRRCNGRGFAAPLIAKALGGFMFRRVLTGNDILCELGVQKSGFWDEKIFNEN